MANLTKLEFAALDISGKNYLSWLLDAEIHLAAEGLGDTLKEGNDSSDQNKAKAMIFLRHHLHESLKNEYLTVKDPLELWTNLKDRYDHQKNIILPKARYDWIHLRLQDFKSVTEYNSAVFNITSQLKLCGEKITDEDMLEKTFTTFHASNILLQQQYREKGFKKYSELISCLLVAEQNNELLMKNHEARPSGATPFPEVNVVTQNNNGKTRGRGRGQSFGRGINNGFGRGFGRGSGRGFGHGVGGRFGHGHSGIHKKTNFSRGGKVVNKNEKEKGEQSNKNNENICYRCGGKGHWARTCRTPKHLIDLYQQSLKGKKIETHFADGDFDFDYGGIEATYLDVEDFLAHSEEKVEGNENVKK